MVKRSRIRVSRVALTRFAASGRRKLLALVAPEHGSESPPPVVYAFLVIGSVLLAFTQVVYRAGWPISHEGSAWIERVNVSRNAIAHFDLLPIWWPDGAVGLGSPLPLLYHKVFTLLVAWLSFLSGDIKHASLIVLMLVSVVGICGLRSLCTFAAGRSTSADVLALTFPHLGYSVTNWLVRGAFAEYVAMAFGVWLLAQCVRLLRPIEPSWLLAPIAALVFLAHSVVALYGGLLVLVALLMRVLLQRKRIRFPRQLALAAMGAAAALLPLMILMGFVAARANTSYLDSGPYRAASQFVAPWAYIWDAGYSWGRDWRPYTVQLDPLLLLALAGGALAALLGRLRRSRPAPPMEKAACAFLLLSLGLLAVLQLRMSAAFYERVPLMSLIQFPWRLLGLASPILVALLAQLCARTNRCLGRGGTEFSVAAAALMLATSPAIRPIQYEWLPAEVLALDRFPRNDEWREYWPARADKSPQVEAFLRDLVRQGVTDVGTGRCEGKERRSSEYLVRTFSVKCRGRSRVAVPVASFGLVSARHQGSGKKLKLIDARNDPRVIVDLGRGDHVLRIELPTVWRVLENAIFP